MNVKVCLKNVYSPKLSVFCHLQSVAELEVSNMESSPSGGLGQPVPEVHSGRTILILQLSLGLALKSF